MRLDEFAKTEKKTLYVSRPVVNAKDIATWAEEQGFESILDLDDMHVTLIYSKTPLDWNEIDTIKHRITIKGGDRSVEQFGDNAIVLELSSDELEDRWRELKDAGAVTKYPNYRPHITITYKKPKGLKLADVEPYRGKVILGPEKHAEVDSNWRQTIKEDNLHEVLMDYRDFLMEASSSAVFHEDAAFQRADNWSFYGDEDGHIAVRKMSDGMLKITGMKGVLSSIILGFSQLQRENSPIWGAVSPAAAKLARRFDFVSSNAMPGGTALLHVMAKTVPGFPSVAKDGSLEDKEDGGAHKLLIGNKAYFASIMRNPDIQAKARRIPGISSIMAIIASK